MIEPKSVDLSQIAEEVDRFESAWRRGERPRIEDYLARVPAGARADLLPHLLAVEVELRGRNGEFPAAGEYEARSPDHAGVVRLTLPGVSDDPDWDLGGLAGLDAPAPALAPSPGAGPTVTREVAPADPGTTADHTPTPDRDAATTAGPDSATPDLGWRGPSVTPLPPGVPATIGRYAVLRRLGQGAFGDVYLARDPELHRLVAIKVPRPDRIATAADVEAYLAEARVLARLDHPGIVTAYDAGRMEDGRCYVVSKYIEGSDLARRLAKARPSTAEAVEIVARAAEALHHAHERGLVHRDIKPANILLDREGQSYVADFGLALKEEDFGKGSGFAGTPAYMSPEQARGEGHRVDRRSDVYSLGVVLYELLTGERAARGDDLLEIIDRIANEEPTPPRQVDPQVPAELDRICTKALAKRATDRYGTGRELADDLRHWERARVAAGPVGPSADGVAGIAAAPRILPRGLRPFDAEDADVFPQLLPGPRGRDGLPESLRFWKGRVEETDGGATFRVGLLLGPSGGGKSSLVRSGLIPRLAAHVLPIYVEATFDDTERTLVQAVAKRCPGLPAGSTPAKLLAALRRGHGPAPGRKVLLILDQFEQWLFARGPGRGAALLQALRQCDGGRVQCLLLARDDFALAATQFMAELEVPIVQGRNFAALDLFDHDHARAVLERFGRALGRLPDAPAPLTDDQARFLDAAVSGLAQEGKVVPVRIALFAEMTRGRPWSPGTLDAVGGAEGIGVAFLDESLGPRAANPEHRLHHRAACAVLEALLPRRASQLRGPRRSPGELAAAAGYADRPKEFAALLHVLDRELRLITPIRSSGGGPAAVGAESDGDGDGSVYALASDGPRLPGAGGKAEANVHADAGVHYQLAHDYLVPILREWFGRLKRETPRGRAELTLAERAAVWDARPQVRLLPSWWEWVQILRLTRRSSWTDRQRRMMRAATRWHAVGTAVALALAGLVLFGLGRAAALDRERLELAALRDRAELRADTLGRRIYAGQLADAEAAFRSGDLDRAGRLLDACEPSARGWEWRHLRWLGRGPTALLPWGRDSRAAAHIYGDVLDTVAPPGGDALVATALKTTTMERAWNQRLRKLELVDVTKLGPLVIRRAADGGVVRVIGDPADSVLLPVKFSPDGRRLFTGGVFWDVSSGRRLWTVQGPRHHADGRGPRFSPDGRTVVLEHWDGRTTALGQFDVLDVATGLAVGKVAPIKDPVFNPKGAQAVVLDDPAIDPEDQDNPRSRTRTSGGGRIGIADALTGRRIRMIRDYARTGMPHCRIVPDAPRLIALLPAKSASGSGADDPEESDIDVWDTERGRRLWSGRRAITPDSALVFGPGGRWFAHHRARGPVQVWETDTGRVLLETKGGPEGVAAVVPSPDGRRLAVADRSGILTLWDVGSGRLLHTLDGRKGTLAFNAVGTRLVALGDDHVTTFWDVRTGVKLLDLSGVAGRSIRFSDDDQWLLTDSAARFAPPSPGREAGRAD